MKWQEPPAPPVRQRAVKYQAEADALRARPGEWALIAERDWAAKANSIMSGDLAAFRPAGAFEATVGSKFDGGKKGDVYARYVGEPAETAPGRAPVVKGPQNPFLAFSEADIRADERERVAQYLEELREQMLDGKVRHVPGAVKIAQIIRGLT